MIGEEIRSDVLNVEKVLPLEKSRYRMLIEANSTRKWIDTVSHFLRNLTYKVPARRLSESGIGEEKFPKSKLFKAVVDRLVQIALLEIPLPDAAAKMIAAQIKLDEKKAELKQFDAITAGQATRIFGAYQEYREKLGLTGISNEAQQRAFLAEQTAERFFSENDILILTTAYELLKRYTQDGKEIEVLKEQLKEKRYHSERLTYLARDLKLSTADANASTLLLTKDVILELIATVSPGSSIVVDSSDERKGEQKPTIMTYTGERPREVKINVDGKMEIIIGQSYQDSLWNVSIRFIESQEGS